MRKGKKGKGQKRWEKTPPPAENNFWLRHGVSQRTSLFRRSNRSGTVFLCYKPLSAVSDADSFPSQQLVPLLGPSSRDRRATAGPEPAWPWPANLPPRIDSAGATAATCAETGHRQVATSGVSNLADCVLSASRWPFGRQSNYGQRRVLSHAPGTRAGVHADPARASFSVRCVIYTSAVKQRRMIYATLRGWLNLRRRLPSLLSRYRL